MGSDLEGAQGKLLHAQHVLPVDLRVDRACAETRKQWLQPELKSALSTVYNLAFVSLKTFKNKCKHITKDVSCLCGMR